MRSRAYGDHAVSYRPDERDRLVELALALEGDVRWHEDSIVSLSRVRPWRIDFPPRLDPQSAALTRTRLTAFGEPRSRPFAIYRDSVPRAVLPVASAERRRWQWRGALASPYTLSQFMVDVAPRWVEAAPRAAIVVTDQGAADWIVVEADHVQLGWERARPTVEQLRLAIGTLQQLTALPRSPLPFR